MSLLANLRIKAKRLIQTPFQQGWQFRVEFDIPSHNPASALIPNNFSVYVKGITHGGFTIDYESKRLGAANINSPISKSAGSIRMTMRDNESGDVETLLRALCASVVNSDGTINLPPAYLFKIRLFGMVDDETEILRHEWTVSAEEMSELERNYENVTQNLSFEVSFKKYRS